MDRRQVQAEPASIAGVVIVGCRRSAYRQNGALVRLEIKSGRVTHYPDAAPRSADHPPVVLGDHRFMKRNPRHKAKRGSAKSILRLPDLEAAKSAVLKLVINRRSARLSACHRRVRRVVLLRTTAVIKQNGSHPVPNGSGVAQSRSRHH